VFDARSTQFAVAAMEPLVLRLSFAAHAAPPNASCALALTAQRRAQWHAEMAGYQPTGGMHEAMDALATSVSWNVVFDPRVSVTVPVSKTFEPTYDFLFFDWDMCVCGAVRRAPPQCRTLTAGPAARRYFLSLISGTRPAACSQAAFEIGVTNLIEVTQTRSAYGFVMNKRAALGASSSDSNDRSEPMVGAMVLQRIWHDAGEERRRTLQWVMELLWPTLLQWNQWSWRERRYGAEQLIVLGSDDNLPCEGSTVGLNSSQQHCVNKPLTRRGTASMRHRFHTSQLAPHATAITIAASTQLRTVATTIASATARGVYAWRVRLRLRGRSSGERDGQLSDV
jgi:hypothetical protein